jgi:hypothetical protein
MNTHMFPEEKSTQKNLSVNEKANWNAGPWNEIQAHSPLVGDKISGKCSELYKKVQKLIQIY